MNKDIINDTNPLDMMNQVIMSNNLNLYSDINKSNVNEKNTKQKEQVITIVNQIFKFFNKFIRSW